MKGMQVLNRQKSYHFRIEEDDGTVIQVSSPLIAAMLTDSAGSFRNLIPPEDRNKGVIKLCLFHDFEWLLAIRQAPKLLAGIQMGPDFVTVVSLKKAHISIDENDVLWTNVDGDKGPKFPIDLEILPACLPVFVPKDARDDTVHFPHFFNSVAPHIHFPGMKMKSSSRRIRPRRKAASLPRQKKNSSSSTEHNRKRAALTRFYYAFMLFLLLLNHCMTPTPTRSATPMRSVRP